MNNNNFLKIPFWFLTVVPFYTDISLASEQVPDNSLSQANFPFIQQQEPSVETVIAKLKAGKAISMQDEKISDEKLKQFYKNCSSEDLDYFIFIVNNLQKQKLFPELKSKIIPRGEDEKASAMAQTNLGVLYMRESIFPNKKSGEYFKKAIQQGSVHAEFLISGLYECGWIKYQPTEKNYLERAAERGYVPAQSRLGKNLILEIKQDNFEDDPRYKKGKKLLKLAAAQDDHSAYETLAGVYGAQADFIDQNDKLNEEEKKIQKSKKIKKSIDLLTRVAEHGDPGAQLELGAIYEQNKDYLQAFKWFKAATDQGNKKSKIYLANMNWNGVGVEKDQDLETLHTLAQEYDNAKAQFRLAEIYEEGKIVSKDDLLVIAMRLLSSKGELEEDQFNQVKLYLKNQIEYVKAKKYTKKTQKKDEREFGALAQNYAQIWKSCPEVKTIENLLHLKKDPDLNAVEHLNKISEVIPYFFKTIGAFDQPEFMITCVKLKNSALKEQMKTSDMIRSWSHGESPTYYNFGPKYVKYVDIISDLLSPRAFWQLSRDYLLTWHQDLLEHYQTLQNSNDDKTDLTDKEDLLPVIQRNIKFFEDTKNTPEMYLTLLESFTNRRNNEFKNTYPYFDDDKKKASFLDSVKSIFGLKSDPEQEPIAQVAVLPQAEIQQEPSVQVLMLPQPIPMIPEQIEELMRAMNK
ncbi:MAG: tetratricopeptide repeat protein [Janthinobacterium lividum]